MLHFLFSFKGRISRPGIWQFVVGVWLLQIALIVVLFLISETSFVLPFPLFLLVWNSILDDLRSGPIAERVAISAQCILTILVTIAWFAVITKRLHDRNKSAWWFIPFLLLPMAGNIAGFTFLSSEQATTFPALPIFLVAFAFGVWGSVELLFLQGTTGPNRFGPDPLGGPVINPFSGETSA